MALRLGVCTAVAIGLLIVDPPIGWGVIAGLALFQATMLFNALIALIRFQRQDARTAGHPMLDAARMLAVNIPVGEHVTRNVGGLNLQYRHHLEHGCRRAPSCSAWGSTCAAGSPPGCPGNLQLLWEFVVG